MGKLYKGATGLELRYIKGSSDSTVIPIFYPFIPELCSLSLETYYSGNYAGILASALRVTKRLGDVVAVISNWRTSKKRRSLHFHLLEYRLLLCELIQETFTEGELFSSTLTISNITHKETTFMLAIYLHA
jgi:hypothetical protein